MGCDEWQLPARLGQPCARVLSSTAYSPSDWPLGQPGWPAAAVPSREQGAGGLCSQLH